MNMVSLEYILPKFIAHPLTSLAPIVRPIRISDVIKIVLTCTMCKCREIDFDCTKTIDNDICILL